MLLVARQPRPRAREAAKPTATPTESVAMEVRRRWSFANVAGAHISSQISSGEEDEPADGGPAGKKGKGKAVSRQGTVSGDH